MTNDATTLNTANDHNMKIVINYYYYYADIKNSGMLFDVGRFFQASASTASLGGKYSYSNKKYSPLEDFIKLLQARHVLVCPRKYFFK